MKTTITQNNKYELKVDSEKNRAYLKVIGFWRNLDEVSDYIEDWKKALKHLKKDFTLLTDASEMKTHPQEVKVIHEQAQKLVVENGLKQVAEVVENVFTTAQLNKLANDSTMPKKNFISKEEAEEYLETFR